MGNRSGLLSSHDMIQYAKRGLQSAIHAISPLPLALDQIITDYAFDIRERFSIEFRVDNRGCPNCGDACACLWHCLHFEYRERIWDVEELHSLFLKIGANPPSSIRDRDRHLLKPGDPVPTFWTNLNIPKQWSDFQNINEYLQHVNDVGENEYSFAQVRISRYPPWS